MTGEQKQALIKQALEMATEHIAKSTERIAELEAIVKAANLPAKSVRMTLNVGVGIDVSSGVRSLYIADESTPDTITLTFDIVDGKLRQVFEERGYHDVDYKVVYHDVEPVNIDEVWSEVMAKHEVRWFMSVGPAFDYLCRHEGSGRSMMLMTGRWEKGMDLAGRLEEVSRHISRELTAAEAAAYMKKHSIPEVPHG